MMSLGCNESTDPDEVMEDKKVGLTVDVSRLDSDDELMRTKSGIIRAENGVIVFTHDQSAEIDVAGFVNSPAGCSDWDDLSIPTEPSVETLFHGITEDGWMCVDVKKMAAMIRSQVPDGETLPGSFVITGGYRPGDSAGWPEAFGELVVDIDMDKAVDLDKVHAEDKEGRSTRDGNILQATADGFDGIIVHDLFDPEGDLLDITASFDCLNCKPSHTVVITYKQSDEMAFYPSHYNAKKRLLMVYFDSSKFCTLCTYSITIDVVSNGKTSRKLIGKVNVSLSQIGGGGIIITPMN